MNFANATTNALASTLNTAIGSNSYLKLYTNQMATPDVAETGTLIASIPISAFSVSSNVVSAPANISATAIAGGTVAEALLVNNAGAPVFQLNYGTDFTLSNAQVNANTTVTLTSLSITISQ